MKNPIPRFHLLSCAVLLLLYPSLASAAQGERVPQNDPGLVVDLGVGLWAVPLPMDWDGDGDNDLVVSDADMPYRGVYLFENDGSGIFSSLQAL